MANSAVSLSGKRIVITGGARGLGRAFAQAAVGAGARVVIADVLYDLACETAATLNKEVDNNEPVIHALPLDLGDVASIDACVTQAHALLGGFDGLINNGAIATGIGGKSLEEIDVETWDKVMQVNVRGLWLMTKACIPGLRGVGNGKIVNLASDTALWGAPNLMHYVASKGAVIAMTRSMARELGEDGISVNAIAPGLTDVEATAYVPEARKQHYVDGRSMHRVQQPDDVVGTALFLCSDAADFVTGQVIPVNGGFVFV